MLRQLQRTLHLRNRTYTEHRSIVMMDCNYIQSLRGRLLYFCCHCAEIADWIGASSLRIEHHQNVGRDRRVHLISSGLKAEVLRCKRIKDKAARHRKIEWN